MDDNSILMQVVYPSKFNPKVSNMPRTSKFTVRNDKTTQNLLRPAGQTMSNPWRKIMIKRSVFEAAVFGECWP